MSRKNFTTTIDQELVKKAKKFAVDYDIDVNEIIEYFLENMTEKEIEKIVKEKKKSK